MPLTLYKASAGSGKTYTLTGEYLHLAFEEVMRYKNILAVTFTNKATEEMKSRILNELYFLATGNKEADHAKSLMEAYHLNEDLLKQRAFDILNKILHDYSGFSVSTIDKFFQKVIRSFSREIGINGSYNIELDNTIPIATATSNMIQELDKPENKDLLEWLISFSQTKIAEGKNWDIFKNISSLGNELFKESYLSKAENIKSKLKDKAFLYRFKDQLEKTKSDFEATLTKAGTAGFEIINTNNLAIEDFAYGKSGPIALFIKCLDGKKPTIGKRIVDANGYPEKWYTKSSKRKVDIEAALSQGMMALFEETLIFIDEHSPLYNSAILLLRHFNQFGVLADLERRLIEYERENNVMLIGNTTELLSRIIDHSDTPFIYEKTGTRYHHFMMDEFQDTSRLQWDNFRPLLQNSLSEQNKNLIVGDVKQSIYRFRNSDWKLLAGKVTEEVFPFIPEEKVLPTNWRSYPHIIRFNNSYFKQLAQLVQSQFNQGFPLDDSPLLEQVTLAYSDVCQEISPKAPADSGYVSWEYFTKNEEDKDFKPVALERVVEVVKEAQDNGYQLQDIAILVRGARDGNSVAQHLLKESQQQTEDSRYCFDVISNEALLLNGSDAIRLIIKILRLFDNPHDRINRTNISQLLINLEIKQELELTDAPFNDHESSFLNSIRFRPLEEIITQLFSFFKIDQIESELPYIQSFQDTIQEFLGRKTSDIHSFLEWWEESGGKKSVTAPKDQNAINIITIHKSKGLEFPIVIIPFMEMNFVPKGNISNIIWCSSTAAPLNEMDVLPITYCNDMESSVFSADYYEEKLNNFMDEINLTYVAFTRAKEALFVFSEEKEQKGEAKNIAELSNAIWPFTVDIASKNEISFGQHWNDEEKRLTIGKWSTPQRKDDLSATIPLKSYPTNPSPEGIRLKLHARDFMTEGTFESSNMLDKGKIMHEVFERINVTEDLKPSLQLSVQEGKLLQRDADELFVEYHPRLQQSIVSEWFSMTATILSEQSILTNNGHTYRPDRLVINGDKMTVIDYKFGDKEEKKYNRQVQQYMKLLMEMGYTNVEGFIWYVRLDKVSKI